LFKKKYGDIEEVNQKELIRRSKSNNDRKYNGQKHENTNYGQYYSTHRKLKIEQQEPN
jgi:hypothetical protein